VALILLCILILSVAVTSLRNILYKATGGLVVLQVETLELLVPAIEGSLRRQHFGTRLKKLKLTAFTQSILS